MTCPFCQRENPPENAFCGGCGARLGDAPAPSRVPSRTTVEAAEHRHLTVVFCDVAGSTQLAGLLDVEAYREVVRDYHDTVAAVIDRFDGHIAQYLGDGVLVYFGYPRAHEDDHARAVSAALAVLGELPVLNDRLNERLEAFRHSALQLRIGIHSGPVVVGDVGGGARREHLALGDTVNIAARLQEVAEPGTVVISDATRRLVGGAFALEALEARPLKGVARPVPAFRVLGATATTHDGTPGGLTLLVGRDREMALLLDRWTRVKDAQGQVVLVSAEAGMGKTRLVQALRERLAGERHAWLECRCSPYHQNSAFYPVIGLLQQGLRLGRDDSAAQKIAKLERALDAAGMPLVDNVPLLGTLLSVPIPAHYPPLTADPQTARRRTLEALSRWLFGLAEIQPVVLVTENLHWSDPSSLELLGLLISRAPGARVLVIPTFRPSFQPPWENLAHVTSLTLNPLSRSEVVTMLQALLRDRSAPAEVWTQIVARTDGVPLFVEELTKAVLEADPRSSAAIPTTLQNSLMARLDRLGPAKPVAQLAAVLGREFSYELIEAVSQSETGSLERALEAAVRAELLQQRGVSPHARYIFKHALIQDTAYQSLLKATRQQFHARTAEVLEKRFPERAEAEPELIARHFEGAGDAAGAIAYYQRAASQALRRSGHQEAIAHLGRALELLPALPEGPDRNRRELRLLGRLGVPLMASRGYASAEVERTYARARELCREIDDAPLLFASLQGLASYYQVRGEPAASQEFAEQLVAMASFAGDPFPLLHAHLMHGGALYWKGELAGALEHLERARSFHRPEEHRFRFGVNVQDPGVHAHSQEAWALWHLGYPDRALERSREAVGLARRIEHPFSLASALGFAATIHQMRREIGPARELAEEAVAISGDHSFPLWLGWGLVLRAWARGDAETPEGRADELRQGVLTFEGTGARSGTPYLRSLLAEALRDAGRGDDALCEIDGALAISETNALRYWDAELHRLRGEILVGDPAGRQPEAEGCFRRALQVAASQQARSLELRAALGLGRLLHARGPKDEARALLGPIHAWFTEGLDTADLQESRALLAVL